MAVIEPSSDDCACELAFEARYTELRAEVGRLRGRERDTLIDFCAHLEVRGLRVPLSWAAMVDAFLAEYDEREALDG